VSKLGNVWTEERWRKSVIDTRNIVLQRAGCKRQRGENGSGGNRESEREREGARGSEREREGGSRNRESEREREGGSRNRESESESEREEVGIERARARARGRK
jgi:hypothetical protein